MADQPRRIPAIPVKQWLTGWNKIDFDPDEHRSKPPKAFHLFALPARELRTLSGIVRRQAKDASSRSTDLGIQRQHDPERSDEINSFVEFGYPWSTLSEARRQSAEFNDLRKPGWLPTAVVINILPRGATRNGSALDDGDVATIAPKGELASLELPYSKWSAEWAPKGLPPFEVIDGQHRLWAFDGSVDFDDYELPVVAFSGLDISWQAYLFWTINIKPKRINSSLAYDLYPLLRSEDWLDRAEGHAVYRETRAQELTEVLWSNVSSPWYDRINMLGERGNRWVSQSAWIKTLIASFIRPWDGRRDATGGLFGGRSKNPADVLGWSRAQQAAFLIFIWDSLRAAVASAKIPWTEHLRSIAPDAKEDLAFYGPYSLINTDQGVRGYMQVINDICYRRASQLKLNTWRPDPEASSNPIHAVDVALNTLKDQSFAAFVGSIGESLAKFDWRASSTPELDEQSRRAKLVFRGSSGYKEIRTQLLEHLAADSGDLAETAKRLVGRS
jgi:DGQHR domain-containing protein